MWIMLKLPKVGFILFVGFMIQSCIAQDLIRPHLRNVHQNSQTFPRSRRQSSGELL